MRLGPIETWRDVPSSKRMFGVLVYAEGLTIYFGRQCFRMLWWRR